jgi:hypothetical protein
MEIADRMQELTQNILSSSEERAKDLTKVKVETNTLRQAAVDMIKDFSASRVETSHQLRRDLAQSKTDRRKGVIQSRKNAQGMIQDFHDSRRKSGEQLRKDLAQGSKILSQAEKKRKQEVGKMLETFQDSREAVSAELKKDLAEGKAKMTAEVNKTLTDAGTLINGFQASRRTMGVELKNDLGKTQDERKASVEGMRGSFRKTQAEVKADLKGASDAWKEMGSAMRNKTSSGKPEPEEKLEKPVEIAPNLEEKLLSIINQHAEGISLSDVAKELGVVTIVLGKVAKVLLDQGKVRKEEKMYFPVTS